MPHAMGSPVARAAALLQLCSIVVAHNGGPHGVMNVGVITVPQQQVVVVERLGKFHKMLPAGLHFCVPYPIDHLRMHDLKERPYHLEKTPGITRDNVDLIMDGVVYLRIVDAYRANYAISDPIEAMLILAQTTVCSYPSPNPHPSPSPTSNPNASPNPNPSPDPKQVRSKIGEMTLDQARGMRALGLQPGVCAGLQLGCVRLHPTKPPRADVQEP